MKVRFSTILTRGFLFSRLGASISASRPKFQNKKDNIKRKPLAPGYWLMEFQLSELLSFLWLQTSANSPLTHTRQSEIVLEFPRKNSPNRCRSCLEMSSDFNYNFGFVVGETVVPGHTRKSRCFDA